jgi:TonB family protein
MSVASVVADGTPAFPPPVAPAGSGWIAIMVSLGLHGLFGFWLAGLPTVMDVKAGAAVGVIEVEMMDADVASTAGVAVPDMPVHTDDHSQTPTATPDAPPTATDGRATAGPEASPPAPIDVPPPATSDASPTAAATGDTGPVAPSASISDTPAVAISGESGVQASIAETAAATTSVSPPDKKASKRPIVTGSSPSGGREIERHGRVRPKPVKRPPSERIANLNATAETKTSGSAGASPVVRQSGVPDGLTSYLQSIRSRITSQRPRGLGDAHGRVEVRFEVVADGRLRGLSIERSPDEALDEEALRIVRRASPVAPIPSSFGQTVLSMTVIIEFR